MRILPIVFAGLVASVVQAAVADESSATSVWDGVYTEGQAEKGSAVLTEKCAECHAANMKGGPGVPPLVGLEFRFGWDKRSLGELYEYLITTMPTGQPGSLSDQAYADIIAAVLQLNGIPTGKPFYAILRAYLPVPGADMTVRFERQ